MKRHWTIRLWESFSAVGLLTGTLFFAASLTPSLVPRDVLMQGALSGCSLAVGYGIGVFGLALWTYLELPQPRSRAARLVKLGTAGVFAVVAIAFLWRASQWQNSIRELMGLEPVDSMHPFQVGLIAVAVFAVLIALARLFQATFRIAARNIGRFAPRRVSRMAGAVVALLLFWSVAEGVFFRFALHLADSSFQRFDALIEDGRPLPTDPNKTGSTASLLDWDGLGRAGREYISTGPTKEALSDFLGHPAQEPLRVYVGLNSAETTAERARLALEELKRVGGFERSMLIVVVPTGTGWIDPEAMNTVEYLHGGDVASVAIQYSYLTSWLSLLVEPDYGRETARALFAEIYGHWTRLPREHRPKLYLHGLSLGALNSDLSTDLFDVIGDPFHGALWSGPPFSSRTWNTVTKERNPGSPAWLPRFRDGSVIRFTDQENQLSIPDAEWGPMRIVYLQYASDAVTFFDPLSFYRAPAWMVGPRGRDVSPELRWYPVVTFLQLLFDMATATRTPMGYGHVYAPEHYIDAWVEVTDVKWSPDQIALLKSLFER
jgi:uncharacterized membrane protein